MPPTSLGSKNLRSLSALIKDGYGVFRNNYHDLIIPAALLFIAGVLSQAPVMIGGHRPGLFAFSGIFALIASLLSISFTLAIVRIALGEHGDSGKAVTTDSLRKFFPLAWVMFLQLFFVVGGMLFFVIPGVIFAAWFAFSLFAFARGHRGMNALLYSKHIIQGKIWQVIWRYVAISFLSFVTIGLVSFPLALIVGQGAIFSILYGIFTTILSVFLVCVFSGLFADLEQSAQGEFIPVTKTLKRPLIIAILGYLLLPIIFGLMVISFGKFGGMMIDNFDNGMMERVMNPEDLEGLPPELQELI